MPRAVYAVLGLLAVALVPVLLYFGITVWSHDPDVQVALWGPIAVLAADAVLFFLALGAWPMGWWDRVGVSLALPLLLAIVSWWAMMDMVAAQMPQGG